MSMIIENLTMIIIFLIRILIKKKRICYNIFEQEMEGRIKSLERNRKGEKTMSRFLKEMIGKKPMITSELIGTNDWLVVDVDEDWVKLSKTDKKGQRKTKLMRIEDIRSVELLEN